MSNDIGRSRAEAMFRRVVVTPEQKLDAMAEYRAKPQAEQDGKVAGGAVGEAGPKVNPLSQSYRNFVGLTGASFQLGRTSIHLPLRLHFPHLTLDLNHGTGTSGGYFDTSITAWCLQASLRQNAIRCCTPCSRMLPSVILSSLICIKGYRGKSLDS
jgi:hypothetical protein